MRRRFINSAHSVPLSFEALEDGFSLSFSNDVLYSIDDGAWETLPANEYTEEINSGSVISFKYVASILGMGNVGTFNINKKCNVLGNCSSLIPKVLGEKQVSANLFYQLFYNCSTIVDASKLELPATTLANYCYASMFYGCTSLVNAPELPATTLANSCYASMFSDCTSLVNAPELPATTLGDYCYEGMFSGCTSLVNAPELPATTLASSCYYVMFYGCTSLVNAPELPATTLAESCYYYIFRKCTSLVNAPELPATTLANSCYASMFSECTSLVNAPELPATTLANSCYASMFWGCTSLVTAPVLPATNFVSECYDSMFYGCSSLNYIKAMFINYPGTKYTREWVKGVASKGTFVGNKNAYWGSGSIGDDGIPSGWTIQKV